jgi:hypothetical protein
MLIHYTSSKEKAFKYIKTIKSVFQILPKNVQKKINDQCMILLLGEIYGYFIRDPTKHIIIFNISLFEKDNLNFKDQQLIIAHEFAHFLLNHNRSTNKEELEANSLVIQWGFN